MSTSIDNRVVQMEFDNAQFEQGVSQSLQTLTRLDAALNDLENAGGFKGLSSSISSIGDDFEETFSFRGVAALTTFQRIAESVIGKVVSLFSGLKNNYMPVDFIDQAITGGQTRAANIENAKFRLKGLGVAYEDVAEDIDHAVKDTAYGLDSAAKAASIMVAQGMQYGTTIENGTKKVSALGKALRGISGVAAMTNSSYDEIADIFEKIGSRNKVQAREANMLTSRALPLYATLTKYFNGVIDGSIEASDSVTKSIMDITKGMHVVQDDFTDFSKKGVITADIFFEAMDTMFGEHATEANKTYAGSLDNVKAALSRLGAVYYQGHMDNMIEVFNSLRLSINKIKEALTPTIERFVYLERKLTHGFSKILDATRDGMGDALYNLMITVRKTIATITREFHKFFPEINIDKITEKINSLNEKLKNFSFSPAAWQAFKGVLDTVFSALSLVKTAIEDIAYILEPWLGTLNIIAGDLLVIFGDAGSKIGEFNDKLENSTGVRKFVELLRLASETVAGFVSEAFNKLTLIITNLETIIRVGLLAATLVFLDISTRLSTKIEELKTKFEPIISAFNLATVVVLGFASVLGQSLYSLGGSLLTFIGYIVDGFSEGGIKGAFSALLDVFDLLPAALKNDFKPLTDFVHTYIDPFVANVKLYLTNLWLFAVAYLKHTGELIYESLPIPLQNALTKIQELVSIITGCFSTLFGSIGSFITHIATGFSTGGLLGGFKAFLDVVDLFPGAIRNAFAPLTTIIDEAVANAKARFDEFVEEFKQNKVVKAVTDFVGEIRSAFDEFAENISFETLGKRITDFFTDISDAISEFGNTITDGSLLQGIEGLFDLVVGYISSTAIGQFVSAMWDAGKSAVEGLIAGFTDGSVLSLLWSAISALVGSKEGGGILGFFANLVGWHSPWQIMIIAGAAALAGLAIGFRDSAGMKAITGALTDLKNKIVKFFEPIVTEVTKIGNQIRTKISDIYEPIKPYVEEAVNWIKENVTFSNIIKGIGTLAAAIGELGTTIATFVSGVIERIGKKFTDAKNAVTGFFGSLDFKFDIKNLIPNYDELKAGNTALGKVLKWFESIGATVKGIAGWVGKALGGDYGEAIQQALGVTLLIAIPVAVNIFGKLVNKVNATLGTVMGHLNTLRRGIVGITSFIKGFGKAIQLQMNLGSIAKVFTSLSLLVTSVAGSMYFIGKLNAEEFERAKYVFDIFARFLIGMSAIIGALTIALAKLSDNKVTTAFEKGKASITKTINAMGDVAFAVLALGASAWILTKAFESLVTTITSTTITPKQLLGAFGIIAGFVLALGAGVGIIAGMQTVGVVITNKFDKLVPLKPKLFSAALTLLAMAFSMKILVNAFIDLIGICDALINGKNGFTNGPEILAKAGDTLLKMAVIIAGLSIAAGLAGGVNGIGLLAVVASLLLLKQVFISLADPIFTKANLPVILANLFASLVALTAIMAMTHLAGEHAAKGGIAVLLVVGSLILIMKAFTKLGEAMVNIRWQDVVKGLAVMAVAFWGISEVIKATEKCSTSFKSALVILTLNSLIFTMGLMVALMTLCASLSPVGFGIAAVAMGALLGMLSILMKAVQVVKDENTIKRMASVVRGLVGLMWAIGGVLTVLTIIDHGTGQVIPAMVSIGAVIGMMALLVKSISKMGSIKKGTFGLLSGMALALVAAGISLSMLAQFNWANILAAGVSLSAVMFIIGKVFAEIGKAATNGTDIGQFIGLCAGLFIASLSLSMLAKFQWANILGAAVGLSLVAIALAGVIKILDNVDTGWKSIIQLGVLTLALIPIAGSLSKLAKYDWHALWGGLFPMVTVFGVLSTVLLLLDHFGGLDGGITSAIAIGIMSLSLIPIANTLSTLAQFKWTEIWRGLWPMITVIGVLSLILAGLSLIGSTGVGAVGLLAAGASLIMLAGAIWIFASATEKFVAAAKEMKEGAISLDEVGGLVKTVAVNLGSGLIQGIIEGLLGSIDSIGAVFGALGLKFIEWISGLIPDNVKSWFAEKWQGLTEFFTGTGEGTLIGAITSAKTAVSEFLSNLFQPVVDLGMQVKTLFQPAIDFFIGTGEGTLIGAIESVKTKLHDWITNLIPADIDILGTVKGAFQPIIDFLTGTEEGGLLGTFMTIPGKLLSALWEGFTSGFATAPDIKGQIKTTITGGEGETNIFTSMASSFLEGGKSCLQGLLNGLQDSTLLGGIKNAVSNLAGAKGSGNGILGWFSKDTEWESPWGTMIAAGKDAIQGLINGFSDSGLLAQLRTAAESLGGDKNSGSGVLGWFANAVGWHSAWWKTTIAGKDGVQGLINGIEDPTVRMVLQTAAKTLGTDTLDTIVKSLDGKTAGEAVVAIGKKLGINFSYSVEDGVKLGGVNIAAAADQIISMLKGKEQIGQGIFNFLGSQADAVSEYPEYVQQQYNNYQTQLQNLQEQEEETGNETENLGRSLGGSGSAASGAAKSAKEAAEEALRHEKAVRLQNEAVEEFVRVYGMCFDSLEDTTGATEIAKTAIEDLARTFGLTEDEVADTEAEIEDLFMNMYDTIHDSIDGSMKLFERFSSEMSVAPEVMLRNMRSNFTGIEEWSEEIQMLAAKGFSRGLVEELAKEGPASQAKVRTFLKMTFGQMMEANDLYTKKTDATAKATVKAITAMAFAGKTQDELIRLANDGTNSIQSNAAKASLEAANHAQKVLVTYRELRDTVADVVESQMDLFSEFDKKTETSADQMLKNMQSQLQGTRDWANGLSVLAQRGIDDGLLLKLKELGPKGYDEVNAFVQMTSDQLAQANQYYQESLLLPQQAQTQISTSYLNTGLSVAQSMISGVAQGAVQNQEQMRTGLQQAAQGAVAGVKADIQSNVIDADGVGLTMDTEVANSEVENAETTVIPASEQVVAEGAAAAEEVATDAMANAGYNMVAGMVNAMLSDEALSSVRSAAVSLAMAANTSFQQIEDEHSPSRVWNGFGRFLVMGLANGLYENADIASMAATDLATNANNALQQALNQMNADGLDNGLQPTITPVLDLTDIQNGMGVMNGLLNSQTYAVNGIANIDPASIMNQSFALLNDAINRLSMAQAQPSVGDINVVVNAQGIDDPNLLADVVAQRIYTEILSREAVVY